MYSLFRLQNEVNETMRKVGINTYIPVSLNGRLYRVLGRAHHSRYSVSRKACDCYIEFSKNLLANATDETVRDVLLHECAHIICAMRDTVEHGHDDYFASVCAEIGTTNSSTHTAVKTEQGKSFKRYEVLCAKHGVVASYHKTCKTIMEIGSYKCGICKGDLTVKRNW